MLSVRTPLATIADQQQLQLSPLKRLTLADKENTVRAAQVPAGLDVHWQVVGSRTREGGGCLPPFTTRVPLQPPTLSSTRVLASKAARRIFQDSAELVSGPCGAEVGRLGSQ
jgi:ribonucleoside-diphosphate reductase subunit M2